MSKRKIELTEQQYQVLRAIVRSFIHDLETRESYTKQKHCSRKREKFFITINWRAAKLLQHTKEQFK